jgi:ABC transporter substrate binding protein
VKRRELMLLLGGTAITWPLTGRAQPPAKLPVIGFLGAGTPTGWSHWDAAFVQRLRELGWIEGRTVAIEYRWAEGRDERYSEIAAEFVRLKVDVIVTAGGAVLAVKRATSAIPIVFALAADPVGSVLVASLARPGGNVTGLSIQGPISPASESKSCVRLSRVCAGWRSWPMLVIAPPCWKCTRLRQRPARWASMSPYWKSGEPTILRPPSRRSRVTPRPFTCLPNRS